MAHKTFKSFFGLSHTTAARRTAAIQDMRLALLAIGEKAGQDAPIRNLLESLECEAPIGANGKITPAALRVIEAIRDSLFEAKRAYSRLQECNRLDESARKTYAEECELIIGKFCARIWPNKFS